MARQFVVQALSHMLRCGGKILFGPRLNYHRDASTLYINMENWIDEGERRMWFLYESTRATA
jgi:hypothetical protein